MHPFIKRLLVIAGSTGLLLLLAHHCYFFKPSFFEDVASHIAYPFYWSAGIVRDQYASWSNTRESYVNLQEKYDSLKQNYMDLIDQFIALRAEHKQCKPLEILTSFKDRYTSTNAISAKILLRHIDSDEHYIIVNRGLHHGIHNNMIAVYHNHILGRVIETHNWYSKVLLITDQRCSVAAYASSTAAVGIVKGFNSTMRCSMHYVSHLFSIKDNDLIISSGQGLVFPEGFCLGRVCLQNLKEKALYHHIEIEPIINVAIIQYCWLIDGLEVQQ